MLTVYSLCSWFTIRANGLQSVLTFYNPCSRFTIRAHGLQSMLAVYNPCSRFKISAHVLQSMLTLYNLCSRFYNLCSRFTIRAHPLQSVLTLYNLCSRFYNLCSRFTIRAHSLQSVLTVLQSVLMVYNPCSRFAICAQLFNLSLQTSYFPLIWKQANVIPLFKKRNPNLTFNYRPVSLLSVVGKVFEKTVFKYFFNYLHSDTIIYEYQTGFLPGCSTTHHLVHLYHAICDALDKKKKV